MVICRVEDKIIKKIKRIENTCDNYTEKMSIYFFNGLSISIVKSRSVESKNIMYKLVDVNDDVIETCLTKKGVIARVNAVAEKPSKITAVIRALIVETALLAKDSERSMSEVCDITVKISASYDDMSKRFDWFLLPPENK